MSHTLFELYQSVKQQLQPIVETPAQAIAEADLILQGLLNIAPNQIYSQGEQPISEAENFKVSCFLEQRISKRIPVQYLLHEAWFYGHRFYVNPQVLIPRPETELLVEQALAQLQPGMSVLDIGVGSGAIAISLSLKLGPVVRVVGVDVSVAALKVAKINQKLLGSTVDFKPAGNMFEPLGSDLLTAVPELFDMIVSNPPYIAPTLKDTLKPEVLWHEPHDALFPPGDDPYFYYRQIAKEGQRFLKPGGHVIVETGAGMTPDVAQIFMAAGYANVQMIRDYAQLDRIVSAQLN